MNYDSAANDIIDTGQVHKLIGILIPVVSALRVIVIDITLHTAIGYIQSL